MIKKAILDVAAGEPIYTANLSEHSFSPPHRIDKYTALYTAHGSGTAEICGDKLPIAENEIFILSPMSEFSFNPIKGLKSMSIYVCCFDYAAAACLESLVKSCRAIARLAEEHGGYIHISDSDNLEMRDIFIKMINEQMDADSYSILALKSLLSELLVKAARKAESGGIRKIYNNDKLTDDTIFYLKTHMYGKLSNKDLVTHLRVSESYLCRRFKRNTGMTVSQYANKLRVEKMEDILRNTDRLPCQIPEMFNLCTEYTNKLFKNKTGMTMNEYREKYNYKLKNAKIMRA